jgi:hypothetical protein
MKMIEADSEMSADRQRLFEFCCSIDKPIRIVRSDEEATA